MPASQGCTSDLHSIRHAGGLGLPGWQACSALLLASALWSRAVRLTTRRLKASAAGERGRDQEADLDRLRALLCRQGPQARDAAGPGQARSRAPPHRDQPPRCQHLRAGDRRGRHQGGAGRDQNARRVLEQTVADRLPKVEARLAEAKRVLFNRDREIAELAQGARRHRSALEEATSINAQRSAEIDRLSSALTTRGGRRRQAPVRRRPRARSRCAPRRRRCAPRRASRRR